MLKTKTVKVEIGDGENVVFGQSHFIKTVEDLYEALVTASPTIKFGIAFCEASGKRLVRHDGNDPALIEKAAKAAFDIGCGHTFIIYMKDGFPVNVLNRIKEIQEVCRVFCATANPLQVIVMESSQGRGVMAVIDGEPPVGIETAEDQTERREFLRKIRYKR
ncbi:adenosine monophosphate-protein transferase [candidate division GN15 bacterium]|uniref:Adenosine monophosphate-protein transferase n=1 Tax=candidate division GN15 bacterium TaxID=2072418 RepID=A0A855X620_9BACT|nr:MAG: adenosine monophosphate-protein transferase [candidate division GN15 bacterium]